MIYDKIKLREIKKLVHAIMTDKPDTRSSDNLFYYNVLQVYCDRKNIDIKTTTVHQFFGEMASEFPCFESVRRARQKIQAEESALAASEDVRLYRSENAAEYCDFAKDVEA